MSPKCNPYTHGTRYTYSQNKFYLFFETPHVRIGSCIVSLSRQSNLMRGRRSCSAHKALLGAKINTHRLPLAYTTLYQLGLIAFRGMVFWVFTKGQVHTAFNGTDKEEGMSI